MALYKSLDQVCKELGITYEIRLYNPGAPTPLYKLWPSTVVEYHGQKVYNGPLVWREVANSPWHDQKNCKGQFMDGLSGRTVRVRATAFTYKYGYYGGYQIIL